MTHIVRCSFNNTHACYRFEREGREDKCIFADAFRNEYGMVSINVHDDNYDYTEETCIPFRCEISYAFLMLMVIERFADNYLYQDD